MQQWLIKVLLGWLVNNLTEEKIKKWADMAKNVVIPWIRQMKDSLIAGLKNAVPDGSNPLILQAVDAFDVFLEAFLPDNPTTL